VADVLRLGIAGAGVVGRLRARAARDCASVRVVAVADPDAAAAARVAREVGAQPLPDVAEMLERADVDAVVIAAPTPAHEALAVAALAAGKHVLCEKPLAATSEACQRIIVAARAADRSLAVGFNHRYFAPFRVLKRTIEDGVIGSLEHVRALAGHEGLSQLRAEWMYLGVLSGGGAMMDLGIHMADLVRFVAGDIDVVHGLTTHGVWRVPGSEDNALALMRSADGVPIAYHATWTEWRGYTFRLEAYGDRGLVRAQYGPMLNEIVLRQANGGRRRRWHLHARANLRERLIGWEDTARRAFADELRDFVRKIAGERAMIADGMDGLRAVELAEAVYESSRRRAPVRAGAP
jgi:predicted dehydrogenase